MGDFLCSKVYQSQLWNSERLSYTSSTEVFKNKMCTVFLEAVSTIKHLAFKNRTPLYIIIYHFSVVFFYQSWNAAHFCTM